MSTGSDLLDSLFAEAEAIAKKQPHRAQMAPVLEQSPEHEFLPEKNVALINKICCHNCSSVSFQFEGLFEVRRHIRKLESHWTRQTLLPTNNLPRSLTYREVLTDFCAECVDILSYKEEE